MVDGKYSVDLGMTIADDVHMDEDLTVDGGVEAENVEATTISAERVNIKARGEVYRMFWSPVANELSVDASFPEFHCNKLDASHVTTAGLEVYQIAGAVGTSQNLTFAEYAAIDFGNRPITGTAGFPAGGGGNSPLTLVGSTYELTTDKNLHVDGYIRSENVEVKGSLKIQNQDEETVLDIVPAEDDSWTYPYITNSYAEGPQFFQDRFLIRPDILIWKLTTPSAMGTPAQNQPDGKNCAFEVLCAKQYWETWSSYIKDAFPWPVF